MLAPWNRNRLMAKLGLCKLIRSRTDWPGCLDVVRTSFDRPIGSITVQLPSKIRCF